MNLIKQKKKPMKLKKVHFNLSPQRKKIKNN